MDEVYAARYRRDDGRWRTLAAPVLCSREALLDAWGGVPPTAAGSALAAFGDRLGLPAGVRRLEAEPDRAAALLALAAQAWADGEAVDAAAALPLYLRDKVALTTAERAAARGITS
jgi:tRNA threonylcarbamoyladenosine biosynthesis protein TsaB